MLPTRIHAGFVGMDASEFFLFTRDRQLALVPDGNPTSPEYTS